MPESDRVRVPIAVSVATAWRALTDPSQLRSWFGWDYEGLEEEIEQIFRVGATITEPGRVLDTNGGGRLELDFAGDEAVLRVVRTDPPGGPPPGDPIDAGWLTFAQQLRFLLERHPGEERRTAHVAGATRGGQAPLVDALGLAEVAALEAGSRFEAETVFGEALAGEVWFRSEAQLGLVADGYAGALLVLHDAPAPSPTSVTINAFGMDPAALAAAEARWVDWWPVRHETA